MPRAEPEARVKKLEEAQARLNAELQRARGRLAQEKRKRDTRRKILAGAMALDRVARGEVSEQRFQGRYGSVSGPGPRPGAVWAAAATDQRGKDGGVRAGRSCFY